MLNSRISSCVLANIGASERSCCTHEYQEGEHTAAQLSRFGGGGGITHTTIDRASQFELAWTDHPIAPTTGSTILSMSDVLPNPKPMGSTISQRLYLSAKSYLGGWVVDGYSNVGEALHIPVANWV
jgi:hypothetical protein